MPRAALLAPVLAALPCAAGAALPALSIEPGSVTLSGVSSGGAFAIQVHVSWSARVHGIAALAAPPYWCANDNVGIGVTSCQHDPAAISVAELVSAAEYASMLHSVDPPRELKGSRVYLESGTKDSVVVQGVVNKTREFYEHWVPRGQIAEQARLPAEHCWPTDRYGNPCGKKGSPYISNCAHDVAGDALQFLYGALSPRVGAREAGYIEFDQRKYTPALTDPAELSLAQTGLLYVPAGCENATGSPCRLHVAYHGCEQTMDDIGDQFYRHVGLNEWAEANRIVVLYPQAKRSPTVPYNPKGCWDWFAYTGLDYATKLAPQIKFTVNMLDALSGGRW
eukprot:TRINITY_DN8377_c0_g1_i1.p1 TRINITY_DN8377_c0_g1~~TRINITY_DN8377_c0_g1_i1.p1  ORF type:complete len:337 (+),score=82.09 TRINITY_DN8377_c0_g1_i1:75-1085(+)